MGGCDLPQRRQADAGRRVLCRSKGVSPGAGGAPPAAIVEAYWTDPAKRENERSENPQKGTMAAGGRTNSVSENPLHPKSQVGKHLQNNSQSTAPVEARNGYFDGIPHRMFDGFRNGCRGLHSAHWPDGAGLPTQPYASREAIPPNESRTAEHVFLPAHECKPRRGTNA